MHSAFALGHTNLAMGSPSDAKGHDQTSTGASSTLTSSGNDRVHRYDPGAMGRVADITDALIKDGSSDSDSDVDSDDDAIVIGRRSTLEFDEPDIENRRRNNSQHKKTKYSHGGVGRSLVCRQTVMILLIVGIIIVASVAIGYAVVNGDPSNKPYSVATNDKLRDQLLLETAERVVTACSENNLNEDRSICQQLCYSKSCCFQSGKYSCKEDDSRDCAVYAGCEALVLGVLAEDTYEDEGNP